MSRQLMMVSMVVQTNKATKSKAVSSMIAKKDILEYTFTRRESMA